MDDFLDLSATSTDWDRHFILTANLDLAENPFTNSPIARNTGSFGGFQGISFTGVFDGGGHTVYNLSITAPYRYYVGLFGYIGQGGQVKNLGIVNTIIQGGGHVGGLCGYNSGGTISANYSTGSVMGSGDYVGGLCGRNEGTISTSYAKVDVNGTDYVGGLCGLNISRLGDAAIIASCAMGSVSGSGNFVGGLCGFNYDMISDSYATGTVTGNSRVGGLCGGGGTIRSSYATGSVMGNDYVGGLCGTGGTISTSYATGSVTGNNNVGGLCGFNYIPAVNSFWDTETSGQQNAVGSGSPSGIIGKTTAEMQTLATFLDAGWDFVETWAICEGTNYPRLRWQIPAADWVCPDGVDGADFAHLAAWWLADDCVVRNDCDGTDLNLSGDVGLYELLILAELWLK